MRNEERRSRITYGIAIVAVVILGLASRRFPSIVPAFVAEYAGDTLWALMVLLLACVVWPSASTRTLAAGAACFALAIEFSQLYHAPWIDRLRATRIGGLVLGFGFLWSDLLCYAVGIAAGAGLDRWLRSDRKGDRQAGAVRRRAEGG